jgi:hypothetical protein
MVTVKALFPVSLHSLMLVLTFVCAPCNLARAAECPPQDFFVPVPIPGDPDEKGEVFREGKDDKGNILQQWCVLGRKDSMGRVIHGTDWGFRYTSADGKVKVWIGGCFFPAGRNEHSYRAHDDNGNGIPDEFLETTWFNAQPPPEERDSVDPQPVKRDWHFFYKPSTNILTIWKTRGKWTVKFNSNTLKFEDDYVTTQVVGTQDSYPAPAHFVDLKYKGKFLEIADPGPVGAQIVEPVFDASVMSSIGMNDVSLIVVPFAGSGTEADPFQGIQTNVFRGDLFRVTGIGISNPIVTERAALPAFGAWVVDSFTSTSVTFRVTTNAALGPGTIIDGFEFASDLPVVGNPWILDSCSLLTTSFGNIQQDPGQPFALSFGQDGLTTIGVIVPGGSLDEAGLTAATDLLAGLEQRIFNCNQGSSE